MMFPRFPNRSVKVLGWAPLFLATIIFGAAAETATEEFRLLQEVVEWASSEENGGWMSPKVEIRPIGTGGLSGIFAIEDIQEGEAVVEIPWSLILTPPSENSTWCDKVETVREAILDPQTPYTRYLKTRTKHKTPFYWSRPSKELLRELMEGFHWTGFTTNQERIFQNVCQKPMEQSHTDASVLLDTRGEGEKVDLLVPIGDLLNHRNGKHTNVDPKLTHGEKYEIIATRDIQAGEQLQNSYNQCQWCRMYSNPARAHQFHVTPQLFEIYGFVELMPQRWVLPSQRLFFDVDETDEGNLKADLLAKPSKHAVKFMQRRLKKMEDFQSRVQKRIDLPPSERETLLEFCNAIVQAFQLALEAVEETGTSELIWKMPVNKWYWEY